MSTNPSPPNPQIQQFVRNIREKMPTYGSPEHCAQVIRAETESLISPLPPELIANIEAACEIVRASIEDVEILRPSSIIKPKEDWYHGPGVTDRNWPALDSYLREVKGWASDDVDSIDATSSEVVSLLANPAKGEFRCRGLVVGYVQSGKTANMTAVIAKAVDAGYNLIVLLGGMTNKLRAQTQRRLEKDIVERYRHLWQLYTTSDDNGDFVIPNNGSFTLPVKGRAQIAVMKKITSRLNAFHRTIQKTPASILRELKVLLIDDECDQASVNSSRDDFDMTKINEAIRKIIRALPAVSYVGYTATPFANVFIDPFPHNREELDDLYPEDFITALPRPEEYFGAREVFGVDPVDAGNESQEEAGRDMIRTIPVLELSRLRPAKASDRKTFHPGLTDSLRDSVLWFIASCAIRLVRGHGRSHMTMLVHTSPNVIQHTRMADVISDWIKSNEDSLRSGKGDVFGEMLRVVDSELAQVPARNDKQELRPRAPEMLTEIGKVLDDLRIAVENGESERRLDYTGDPRTYIVVGGAVLARGLTLEGLSVSFFLRTAKQYDTLLQMGRWFGYRHGYEDLPRLWTTSDLISNFRSLAHIEEEIRDDIALYRMRNTTPQEFAVKVRAIPGMAITSASKMRHAYRTSISYEGRHVQTIRFDHRREDVVAGNWKAGAKLVDSIGRTAFKDTKEGFLAIGVGANMVRNFLSQFEISDAHMDLCKAHLLGFFDDSVDRMPEWNVGVIQTKGDTSADKPLGVLGKVATMKRSRLKTPTSDENADIKALMSMPDILIDSETRPNSMKGMDWAKLKALRSAVPLMLLYPINSKSEAKSGSKTRAALNAVGDILGMALVFPGEVDRSGGYYSVEIDAPTPEQLDEEEPIEDVEQAELINE